LSARAEGAGEADHRRTLLGGLSGKVVEVGAGNGLNFKHYPAAVAEVIAVEPEPYMLERARERAAQTPVPVRVVEGDAYDLPLADGEADAVVFSLVLCTIPDPGRALAEAHRVLGAGGQLRFYEHVIAERPAGAAVQRAAGPVWRRVSGGCHLTRDTTASIRQAGFEIGDFERFAFKPAVLAAPHILGAATKR
jgi:SAM-dependent methyltransferase